MGDNRYKDGGDDSGSTPQIVKKKIHLDKFGLDPDTNIRDVFWKIMGSYATNKTPGVEVKTLETDKFALMRSATSIVCSSHDTGHGLAPKFIVQYTLMLTMDAKWEDMFMDFLERTKDCSSKASGNIDFAVRKLLAIEGYREQLKAYFSTMLRSRGVDAICLYYLPRIKNAELIAHLKRELIILARGGIGDDQLNAINALAILVEDEEVKKSLIILLSHWDAAARFAAVNALKQWKRDNEVKEAAKRRIELETDEEIRKMLKRISI